MKNINVNRIQLVGRLAKIRQKKRRKNIRLAKCYMDMSPKDQLKQIPDNPHLLLNLNGDLVNLNSKEVIYNYNKEKITLSIYGQKSDYNFLWVQLITHFEVDLPEAFRHRLSDIDFKRIQYYPTKPTIEYTMVFKKPFALKEGTRIIPNHMRYCIDRLGKIVNLETGYCPNIYHPKDKTKYPVVSLYCPEKTRQKSLLMHRLMATTWIQNNNWYHNCIVNHIDGNKHNFNINNLEWVTASENTRHAVQNQLYKPGTSPYIGTYLSRNIDTGEIKEHVGLTALREYVGNSKLDKQVISQFRPGQLIGKKYEVRLKDDNKSWFYKKGEHPDIVGRYHIYISDKQGKLVDKFLDTRSFWNKYEKAKPSNESWHINNAIKNFKKNYKHLKISVKDTFTKGPYYALNIDTGEITKKQYSRDMAKFIQCTKGTILNKIRSNSPSLINNKYIVLPESRKNELTVKDFKHLKQRIVQYQLTKGDTKIVIDSKRELARFLNIDRKHARSLINQNKSYEGYYVNEIVVTK